MNKRHVAFIDVLGIRRTLSLGASSVAAAKLTKLARIIEEVVPFYPGVIAQGATDFFLLWSDEEDTGWFTACATRDVFQKYFDLNPKKAEPNVTFLIRAGLAYGEVEEIRRSTKRLSYSILLGDGLAKAYEAQCIRKGMRLVLAPRASAAFRPKGISTEVVSPSLKIDWHHQANGAVDFSEIRWVGFGEEVDERVATAASLFRQALRAFRLNQLPEDVVPHFQQTLCATLQGCSTPELLSSFLTYRYKQKRAYRFLGPVWATAWLRLFRPKNSSFLQHHRENILEKFLIMSGSPMVNEVAEILGRYNRWRPLIRFLRKAELRFGPRRRRRSQKVD